MYFTWKFFLSDLVYEKILQSNLNSIIHHQSVNLNFMKKNWMLSTLKKFIQDTGFRYRYITNLLRSSPVNHLFRLIAWLIGENRSKFVMYRHQSSLYQWKKKNSAGRYVQLSFLKKLILIRLPHCKWSFISIVYKWFSKNFNGNLIVIEAKAKQCNDHSFFFCWKKIRTWEIHWSISLEISSMKERMFEFWYFSI